jgi:hypothetical protein
MEGRAAMTTPKRIQRKRTKGYKFPEGAVYVGRPTIWGNPWTEEATLKSGLFKPECVRQVIVDQYRAWLGGHGLNSEEYGIYKTLENRRAEILRRLPELRGKDLACWCKEGEFCHADILLELANKEGQK